MGLLEELAAKQIERRDFVKFCAAVSAVFGMPKAFAKDIAFAAEAATKKPAVIWLEGQDCAGCSESFLATLNPSLAELLLGTISLRYHETVMAGAGAVAEEARLKTMEEGGYVLVVEGSIPAADDRFCTVGGKSFKEVLTETAKNAAVIIAAGSCATFNGGIPGASPSKGRGVAYFIKDKPIINLPTCPVKPARLVATIMYYLASGKAPAMDKLNRPLAFYGELLHDNCPRRGQFEAGHFLQDWNDPAQRDYCLLLKGCKGPKTYTDCAKVWWNEGANWCIGAGAPCAGCSQPEFYGGFSPLYDKQDIFNGVGKSVNIDTAGKALVGVAAVGAVVHGAGRLVLGNKDKK
ncbi:MAG TPA: hydrogenase small subunit [Candidatus Aquicultor sp.]|jgi:hydrogenase small subunit